MRVPAGVALAYVLAACASAGPAPAARTPPPSPSPSPAGGISFDEARRRGILYGPYAVGVDGPARFAARAGETARVTFVVTNLGSQPDVYDVTSEHPVSPDDLALDPGETSEIVVRVRVPAGTRGPYVGVRVVVTSRSDRGVLDEATTVVHAR